MGWTYEGEVGRGSEEEVSRMITKIVLGILAIVVGVPIGAAVLGMVGILGWLTLEGVWVVFWCPIFHGVAPWNWPSRRPCPPD